MIGGKVKRLTYDSDYPFAGILVMKHNLPMQVINFCAAEKDRGGGVYRKLHDIAVSSNAAHVMKLRCSIFNTAKLR